MTNTPTQQANDSNRPVAEVRDGAMKIAIWRSEPQEEGGRVRYDSKLTSSFKTADGQWKETTYLSGSENLRAANLHLQAYNKELELRAQDREAARGDGPSPA